MTTNNFHDIITNRRSVRVYDKNYKIPKEEMLKIIQEATLAPSSVNMQPWRFVVVESDEMKETIKPLIRFNTKQNETSSAMILIFGDMRCHDYGKEIYNTAVAKGLMPEEVRDQQLATIIPHYENLSEQEMKDILHIDASLAAMQLMLVAKAYGYDTNAIGGFEKDQLAKAVGLDENRYIPIMIVSIGKAVEEGFPSVRLAPDVITTFK